MRITKKTTTKNYKDLFSNIFFFFFLVFRTIITERNNNYFNIFE
jgi:hypothetical protein